jgi:hypothetical protein
MRILILLCVMTVLATVLPSGLSGGAARAAEDKFHNYLLNTCLATEASWIGKDKKSIEANCACKAKTAARMAAPAFKDAVLKQQPYDKFPFGDPASYQTQILKDCPKLQPLMIDAICTDPNAPKGACEDMKKMVKGLQ